MSKFKVGDKVRGKDDYYTHTSDKSKCEVMGILDENKIRVRVLECDYEYAIGDQFIVDQHRIEFAESAEKTSTSMTTKPILHKNYTLVIRDIKIELTEEELQDLKKELSNE